MSLRDFQREPTGDSSDVVHWIKYDSLLFRWLPKVYQILQVKYVKVIYACPYSPEEALGDL